jgi:hypothetical protein
MQTSQQNDKPGVTSAGPAQTVKNPCGIFTSVSIADSEQENKRRGQETIGPVLARAYRILLAGCEGRP